MGGWVPPFGEQTEITWVTAAFDVTLAIERKIESF
jgi:hypothetical protein